MLTDRKFIDSLDYDNVLHKATLCSYLSTAAYETKSSQYEWLVERFGFEHYETDETLIVDYYKVIDEKNKTFYLVFRGTATNDKHSRFLNLLVSLNFSLKKLEDYKIHRGYHKAGKRIVKKLYFDIKDAYNDGYKIIITGHSLGGVIAKYVSIRAEVDCEVYAFGSPNLATDKFFETEYDVKIYNFVNKGDVICSFPSTIKNNSDYYEIDKNKIEKKKKKNANFLVSLFYLLEIKLVLNLKTTNRKHCMRTYLHNIVKYYRRNK